MFSKIKHLAIVSESPAVLGEFYERLFGMKGDGRTRQGAACTVSDGYLGLNINPRKPGRQGGFDHFGFEVRDVETVFARMREKYPAIEVLKRPGNRPFAGISTHDPAGNVFDLSQEGMENRRGLYVDAEQENRRYVKHFALRAVEPVRLAEFYVEVLELTAVEKAVSDPNFYLTDGRVTLVIVPWKISDYAGTGIERPQLDHLGFKVESIARVTRELDALKGENSAFGRQAVGVGPEGEVRASLFKKCRLGEHTLCDPDGVLIDLSEN